MLLKLISCGSLALVSVLVVTLTWGLQQQNQRIQALQERIRSLQPPQLAAFSQAFRSAFQVPESIPSIAGLITEQRHRAWIEKYLSQGQEQT